MPAFAPGVGYVPPNTTKVIASAGGVVTAVVFSHIDANAQTITLYDNAKGDTTPPIIMAFGVNANVSAVHTVHFPQPGLRFNNGLTIIPGACHVLVIGSTNR